MMTETEQQALFERTRARIQRNLNQIAELSQTCLDPRTFFPQFLRLAVDSLTARGGAVWVLRGDGFERVAEENFASAQFDANPAQRAAIERALREIERTQKPHIIAACLQPPAPGAETANLLPFPFFYIPVVSDGRLVLVLQVWLNEAGDPRTYQDIAAFLSSWGSNAVIFLRNHQRALFATKNEEYAHLLRMQASLLGELEPREVMSVVANFTADLLKADLACLFRRKGKGWVLMAASNQEVIDQKSHQTRKMTDLAGALNATEEARTIAADEDEVLKAKLDAVNYQHVVCKLLKSPGGHADFLLCGFRHEGDPFAVNSTELLNRVGESAGKSLETAFYHHALPLRPILGSIARTINDWRMHRRKKLIVTAVVLAVLGIVLFAIPVPLKITAECVVEPSLRTLAVTEAPGKIVQVLVREGQEVKKGDLLARLNDQEYVTQLAVAEQQKLRWQVEAARAQTAGDEAERKLAEINAQREVEAIKRLEYLRSKTEIRAPIAGTIMTKNLQNREGETLDVGGAFCEIADEENYDLILQIKQNDIGDLLRALEASGRLPVDFILHSHAKHHLFTEILSVRNVSQLPEIRKDHSCFLVKMPFPENTAVEDLLKPGYTGKAKIRIGSSNLFYSWFRPFLNYWRVEWGV